MARPTELEPRPRLPPRPTVRQRWDGWPRTPLPRNVCVSDVGFWEVLRRRRSTLGTGPVSTQDLASILWHATLLRGRQPATPSFPAWESRVAPSAGGLHVISLLCLSLDDQQLAGIYDPDRHELIGLASANMEEALRANRKSVGEICAASTGTTLQFVADVERAEAAYENGESLVWRDAGALLAVIALVADALGFAATPLGRVGETVIRAAGLPKPRWRAVGAIHITSVG